jgi:predicted ferric reductase
MNKRAAIWIGIYLLLVATPMLVLILGPRPPGVEFWWDFSKGLGFVGLTMFGIQFALTARFKRASAPFGIDIIYFLHKYLAWIALFLVFGHFAIIWLFYPEAAGPLDPREARWEITVGRTALLLFALAVVTSQWREKLRIEYGLWRYSHVGLATVGFLLAITHVVGVGYYTDTPTKLALWLLVTMGWIGITLWSRIVKPWQQIRHPYRVVEVRQEADDSRTLALEPAGHSGLGRFRAGQFAWLNLRASPFALREHPFTFSSAPEQLPRVEFTIKPLGDFSSSIAEVQPGEIAYLDGPYGVFSTERALASDGFVFIAGGIGITPMISMLRSMAARSEKRPLWLFYGNSTIDDIAFRAELDQLAERLDLTIVDVINEPPDDWEGESGYLTEEILDRHLPKSNRERLSYFLCGPTPMMDSAEQHLKALGVPQDRVEREVFNLT